MGKRKKISKKLNDIVATLTQISARLAGAGIAQAQVAPQAAGRGFKSATYCRFTAGPDADVQYRVRRRGNREFAAVLEQPGCHRMR